MQPLCWVRHVGNACLANILLGQTQACMLAAFASGEVISEYPDDVPFPSCLILGFVGTRPIHVVTARDA